MPVIGCGTEVFLSALDDINTRFKIGYKTVAKHIICKTCDVYPHYLIQIDIYPDPLSDHMQIIRAVHRETQAIYKVYVKELIPAKKGFHFEAHDWNVELPIVFDPAEQQVLCL